MAFYEGYDVLKNVNPEKAREYKNRADMAAKYIKRHLTALGFDNIGEDDLCGIIPDILCDYAPEADEEKANHGGDEFLSTANNYGNALRTLSHSCMITGNYCDEVGWAADEVRRLQKREGGVTGLNRGGIRDGPLFAKKLLVPKIWRRYNETISYAGMTAFGLRQAYDATGDANAYTVLTELAKHFKRIRDKYGVWPGVWSFEEETIVAQSEDPKEDATWASVIELSGGHILGFRQAIVDAGDYRLIEGKEYVPGGLLVSGFTRGNHYFAATLYTALKKCGDKCDFSTSSTFSGVSTLTTQSSQQDDYIIFCKGCPTPGYPQHEGKIYPGGSITRQVLIDPTVSRVKFEVFWKNPSSDLDLTLIAPDGTVISGTSPGVNHTEDTTYEYYIVRNPASGYWVMKVTAANVNTAGEEVVTRVTLDTTLRAELYVNSSSLIQGEAIKMVVAVSNGNTPVAGATVTAQITKPNGDVVRIPLYDDGTHGDSSANDGNYTGIFSDTALAGVYKIKSTATGSYAGSRFTRESRVEVEVADVIPPNLSIISPANGSSVSSSFSLRWEGSDNSGGPVYFVYVDGMFNASTNESSITLSGLSEGRHSIAVMALDTSGNFDVEEINIMVDATPPQITILSPLSKNYSYTEDITISYNATDDGSGIARVRALLDGAPVAIGEVIDLFNFSIGAHIFKVEAVDNAGNNATAEVIFHVIDDVPPVSVDDADQEWHNQEVTITLTSHDNKSNVAEVHYILNSGPEVVVTVDADGVAGDPFVAKVLINYEDDNNTLEYWAVDQWGNEEEHHFVYGIKLDKTPPVVRLWLDPLKDVYPNSEPLPVRYEAYDPVVQGTPSNNLTLSFAIDGVPVADPTNVTCLVGTHLLTLTATDLAGNTASASVEFTVSGNGTCATTPAPQCSDGIDNDGDGKVDYPEDPGCASADDNDERDVVSVPEFPSAVIPVLLVLGGYLAMRRKLEI
ncbi:MAG: hypothetical protein GXO66_01325 [Euryarchaeota archaeon]|nr:hypothetical protein [Euryarchaeota archaeon]